MKRSGAFASRVVVELRENLNPGGRSSFSITADGRPRQAEVQLGYAEGEQLHQAATVELRSLSSLRYAIFELPTKRIEELRIWAHRDKPNGDSETLPALVELKSGNKTMQFDLKLYNGQVLLPLSGDTCRLKFTFPNL